MVFLVSACATGPRTDTTESGIAPELFRGSTAVASDAPEVAPAAGSSTQPRETLFVPTLLPSEAAAAAKALHASKDELETVDYASLVPAPQEEEDRSGKSHTSIALGAFIPMEDLDRAGVDTGFWGDITFGHRLNKFISIEPSVGFFTASGNGIDVYGVPLMIDARLGIPVLILEPYVGAGIGAAWIHSKIPGAGSNDDFTYIWDAFLGLEVKLGGFRIGAEYKYVQSGDVGPITQPTGVPGGAEFQLQGSVVSLTGTLPF